jgi:4-amino-4-deoxy-L-arabinose transferase-like glycosyltransferase
MESASSANTKVAPTGRLLPRISNRVLWTMVAGLIVLQAVLTICVVHRESPTYDEGDHMFSAYMMWHAADYGLNPEHPPLVKLLAAVPLLGRQLWVPPLAGRFFKEDAFSGGQQFLARNDGDRNQIVFQMRLSAGLLAIALSLVVFFSAREYFGDWAALAALFLTAFDPTILAHSALVTTDIGVSLFFLASTWCFYRYVKQPDWTRLVVAGVIAGCLAATKHSGILLIPMLLLLIGWEIWISRKGLRAREALRLMGAFCTIVVIGGIVLWSFYGFRYSARPAGMRMSVTLTDYAAPLGPHVSRAITGIGNLHLLPESYLIGLVDVKRTAEYYPTFVLGRNYAHGVWWYFPVVIIVKTTLGLLALTALSIFAVFTRKLKASRELAYLYIPALVYLGVAMASTMNIGVRHLLPFYAYLFVLTGAGAAALAQSNRRWLVVCSLLLAAHAVSSLIVFPNYMAYANEASGGPENVHNLLSDANVDWAQQLFQVKAWQDRHPGEECWFAYFAYPVFDPATYGIRCHPLPTADTFMGVQEIPATIEGNILVSAGDLSGCEWPSASLNPYVPFQFIKPTEEIDHAVFVYRGRFDVRRAAALGRVQSARRALRSGDAAAAIPSLREAVALDPESLTAHSELGDALAASGFKDEARTEWTTALSQARELEAGAQKMFVPDLLAKLR